MDVARPGIDPSGLEERSRSGLWRARGASLVSQRPGRHLIPSLSNAKYAARASQSGVHGSTIREAQKLQRRSDLVHSKNQCDRGIVVLVQTDRHQNANWY